MPDGGREVLKALISDHDVPWIEGGLGELSVHTMGRVEVGESMAFAVRDALETDLLRRLQPLSPWVPQLSSGEGARIGV